VKVERHATQGSEFASKIINAMFMLFSLFALSSGVSPPFVRTVQRVAITQVDCIPLVAESKPYSFCFNDTKLETTWLNRISPVVAVARTTILAKYMLANKTVWNRALPSQARSKAENNRIYGTHLSRGKAQQESIENQKNDLHIAGSSG